MTVQPTLGVWYFTDAMSSIDAAGFARRVEDLGYTRLWLPETVGRDPFAHIAWLASQTTTLEFATGIASISLRHPGAMVQATNTVNEQTGGRFTLGLGVSHEPLVAGLRRVEYAKPLTRMREYLAAMDASPYMAVKPAEPATRLLAALGPKMLELARDAADGAHPYWTTPAHTELARDILGADKALCVEQKVVLTTDATAARAAADTALSTYDKLPNYRNNWIRLGYTEEQIDGRDPAFVDDVVAWGEPAQIRERIDQHFAAGADHVCIQPLSTEGPLTLDWAALEALSA